MLTITGPADSMYRLLKEVCSVVRPTNTLPILQHCVIDTDGIFGTDLEDAVFVEYPQDLQVTGEGVACVRPHDLIRLFGGKATEIKRLAYSKSARGKYHRVVADYTPPCESFKVCYEAVEHCQDLQQARETHQRAVQSYEIASTEHEKHLADFAKHGGRRDLLGNFVVPKGKTKERDESQFSLFDDDLPLTPICVPIAPKAPTTDNQIAILTSKVTKEVEKCRAEGCRHEEVTSTTAYTRGGKPIGNVNLSPPKIERRDNKPIGLKGQEFVLEIPPLNWIPLENPDPDYTYKGEMITKIVDTPTPPIVIKSGNFTAKLPTDSPTEYPCQDEIMAAIEARSEAEAAD